MRTDVNHPSASILADSCQNDSIPGGSGIWVRPLHTSIAAIGRLEVEAADLYSELCFRSEPASPWVKVAPGLIQFIAQLQVKELVEVQVVA